MDRGLARVGAVMVVVGAAGVIGGGIAMREGHRALLAIVLVGGLLAVLGLAVLRGARRGPRRRRPTGGRHAGVGFTPVGPAGDAGVGYDSRDHGSDAGAGSGWWGGGDSGGGWSGGGDSGGGY
ncbi:hypothetical protein [Micromonospora sp. M71_S20]|uniref:hypothetical protein n=1 Tax=Micromonospora sp. M71_S20 TaxID=592872 RepID=UPI0011E5DFAE|nr:hypothetical protein [Micromonospora sp. M71_S20]